MHNEEGKLFDLVFHRLLAAAIAVAALAALVWFTWAIVRMSAITREALPVEPPVPREASSLSVPDKARPLADARQAPTRPVGPPDQMIRLVVRPIASLASRAAERLDHLPRALAARAETAAFFVGGP